MQKQPYGSASSSVLMGTQPQYGPQTTASSSQQVYQTVGLTGAAAASPKVKKY